MRHARVRILLGLTAGLLLGLARAAETPAGQPVAGQPHAADLGDGVKMEFVWVEALKLWVGKYEVTNGEYRRQEAKHDSGSYQGQSLNGDRQPVVKVNMAAAQDFAKWLTERERKAGRLPADMRYRLPTGTEWTTFAQCGDGRTFPWGYSFPPTTGQAGNYDDYLRQLDRGTLNPKHTLPRSYKDGFLATCDVEKSWANPWGLFGVGGNVWEAVTDEQGKPQTYRGASWDDFRLGVMMVVEGQGTPASGSDIYGFRLVLGK